MNFLASSIATIVAVGIGFVATPFLLRWLGEDRLGLFKVSLEWLGYLTLLELGTGAALAPLILQARANIDGERETAILAAGLRRYVTVAVLTLLVGAGLVAALPWVTRTPPELRSELWIGAGLYLLIMSLVFPLALYRALAEATQKTYLVSSLLTAQGIVMAVLAVAMAYAGWGLIGQFLATAVGSIVVAFGLAFVMRRLAPFARLVHPNVDLTEATSRVRSLSRLTLLQSFIGRVCLMTDNIVISLFLGPAAVTAFFLTQSLTRMATTVLQSVGGSTWAGLCELYQTGQHDLFRQRLVELTKITATLGAVFLLPAAVLTKPFVALWVGPTLFAGDLVVTFAVLNAIMLAVFGLWGWVFNGTARVEKLIRPGLISATLNIVLSILFTVWFGLSGPVLGTFVMYVVSTSWILPVLLRQEFGLSIRKLIQASTLPFLPMIAPISLLYLARETFPTYSWLRLACEYSLASLVSLALAWKLVLRQNEKQHFALVAAKITQRMGRHRRGD